jgi:phage terminase small subunit
MPKGGYRPGAGRKRGSKDKEKRKQSEALIEAEKIREMLTYGTKAKARFYQEFLLRVSKGENLSVAEKKLMDKLGAELAAEIREEAGQGKGEALDPLTYMLKVMNDPNEDKEMRARMAIAAAPFIHPRKGEGKGKKDDREDKAKDAANGKFASGRPPLTRIK